jgi:hypothetical protein
VKTRTVKGIVEANETFFRRSAKGSRTLKGRAPRKRSEKAKPGLSTHVGPLPSTARCGVS